MICSGHFYKNADLRAKLLFKSKHALSLRHCLTYMQNENEDEQQYGAGEIEIYSKNAILGFSLFFSPIFGGALLMINLRAIGNKAAGYLVLFFSIAYAFFISYLIMYINSRIRISMMLLLGESAVCNIVGGLILTQYYYRRYFPEEDYYPRSVVKPLMVAFILILLNMFLLRGGMGIIP